MVCRNLEETTVDGIKNMMQSHIRAGIIVATLIILIRIAVAFDVGSVMLFPLFVMMIVVTRLSPPVAALSLLYGCVLFGQMDFRGAWLIPRIPTISTLTIWTIFWLFHWRRVDRSLGRLDNSVVVNHLFLLLLFFGIGSLGALNSGYLSNPLVRFYNWDILRAWIGYLILAMLGCRDLNDLKVILVGLPFAFLIYPFSLPLETWQDFFGYCLYSSEVLSIGLAYGSLNTNTLGQAAAVASVVAAAVGWNLLRSQLRRCMVVLFFISSTIVFMTSSRQALLGWISGLVTLAILSGFRRGLILLAGLSLLIYVGAQAAISILPRDSGFEVRLSELTQASETWASQSFTIRQNEFKEAVEKWREDPFFGVGFGGQRFDELPSSQLNEIDDLGAFSYALYGTHNVFLAILAQTGVVGLILLLSFCIGILRHFFSTLKRVQDTNRTNATLAKVAVLSALVSIFVMQNISGGLGVSSSNLIFLFGALLGTIGAERQSLTKSKMPL